MSSDENSSVIRIKNQSSDATINGIVSWHSESDTESSIKATGQLHPGQEKTLLIPKEKFWISLNNFKMSDIIEPIFGEELEGPIKKCYVVTGSREKITFTSSLE